MKTFAFLFLFIFVFIFLIAPAIGYNFRETHASISVLLSSTNGDLTSAKIHFLDKENKIIGNAIATASPPGVFYNFVQVLHPKLGNCRSGKYRRNFRNCYNKLTNENSKWVNDIKKIKIIHQKCTTKELDFNIYRQADYSDELFLWWLPLPHLAGKPYANYESDFHILAKDCINR